MADRVPRLSNADPHLLSIIAEHTNDCLLVTEAEPIAAEEGGPRIIYLNPAFERMTGYNIEDAIGKTPRMLQHPEVDRRELDRIRDALEGWRPVRAELLNQTKSGEPFWVELDIVPVADETGWYIYWLSLQRDITERKEREIALEKAKARAELLNLRKDAFVANVSHELRTPLNSILGYSELLMEQDHSALSPTQRDYLRSVHDSGRQLMAVVRDLIDLTALQQGALKLDRRWCGARTLLRQARRATDAIRACDEIEILYQLDDPEMEFYADPMRAKQVFEHILSNAVKFSHPGGQVVISARVEGRARVFRISDEGDGMTDEELDLAREPFWQLEDPYSRKSGGLGLGLPLCTELMSMHGGEMIVASTKGHGTTVTLVFPDAEA